VRTLAGHDRSIREIEPLPKDLAQRVGTTLRRRSVVGVLPFALLS